MFKFIHAADIHLDSPLRGLDRYDDLPAESVRGASRRALDNLIKLAVDEKVAFVIIAGDVYDGDWKDHNTGLWFVGRMQRLRDAKIPVFLIRGNHDAQNKMTLSLPLPDNVRQFRTDKAESVSLDNFDVLIHGQGFADERVVDDLAINYPTADRARLNIGILHTSAQGGSAEHARYAPCTVDALKQKGYAYWALGHIHKKEILADEDSWVAFSGNIQGRHIRESGPKGCFLVTVGARSEIESVHFKPLDVLRWETCRVDATGLRDTEAFLQAFEDGLRGVHRRSGGMPTVVRLEAFGPCLAHDAIAADLPALAANARAQALAIGNESLWVERVKIATKPERTSARNDIDDSDAIGVLLATLDELARDPKALADLAKAEFSDLRAKLAGDVSGFEVVRFDNEDWLRDVLEETRPLLLKRLGR